VSNNWRFQFLAHEGDEVSRYLTPHNSEDVPKELEKESLYSYSTKFFFPIKKSFGIEEFLREIPKIINPNILIAMKLKVIRYVEKNGEQIIKNKRFSCVSQSLEQEVFSLNLKGEILDYLDQFPKSQQISFAKSSIHENDQEISCFNVFKLNVEIPQKVQIEHPERKNCIENEIIFSFPIFSTEKFDNMIFSGLPIYNTNFGFSIDADFFMTTSRHG
jgi:hypothetical protein